MLPEHAKISIALDCWTSPFQQAFMAITGYFIDAEWVYREVLLGFKPLHSSHTGANLSAILMETLTEHGIKDRVFGITTDNASNNETLVKALQQSLQQEPSASATGFNVIRVPCLAHVIQLSLNQLLHRLKARPKNEQAETVWTEEQQISLAKANAEARSKKRDIAHTLKRIRSLAVYIRGSPQRRDHFLKVQHDLDKGQGKVPGQGLMPIQDVKTRWNSTFLMLRRAKRLRTAINEYCRQFNCTEFELDDEQWRQIDYLIYLTKPFFDFTLALSKTREATSFLVFRIYNQLFEHLEKCKSQLQRKRVPWKQQMLTSLGASHSKLSEYYKKTDHMRGHIYAVCTMLSPDSRFQFFLSDNWEDAKEIREQYRVAFREALTPIQERLTTLNSPQVSSSGSMPRSFLLGLMAPPKSLSKRKGKAGKATLGPTKDDEMTQYLDGSKLISMFILS